MRLIKQKGDEKGKGVDTQMKSLSMEKKIPVSYPIFRYCQPDLRPVF